MNAVINDPPEIAPAKDMAGRVKTRDWERVSNDLDAQGCAMIDRLLTPEECDAMAGLYQVDDMFRSRVVMGRHGFGRGEYKYFSYPLPDIVAGLRTSIYPQVWCRLRIAGTTQWVSTCVSRRRMPISSRAAMLRASVGRRRCCCNMRSAITTVCIKTCTASTSFRCRSLFCYPSRDGISRAASLF